MRLKSSLSFSDDELKRREAEYASYHDLSLFIGSWNIDASKPGDLEQRPDDKYLFDRWLGVNADTPDIVVFGLQEIVDLESKKVAAKGFLKNATAKKQESQVVLQHDHVTRASAWKERIVKALKDKYKTAYHFVDSRNLVGLFTCVFVKEEYQRNGRLSNFQSYTVSTGRCGMYLCGRFCRVIHIHDIRTRW